MLSADPDGEAPIWARVATAFAGDQYGMHALPDVGEEVLVVFAGNDSAHPIVVDAGQGNRLNVHCRIAAFMQASSHAAERRFCGRLILPGARRSRFIAA